MMDHPPRFLALCDAARANVREISLEDLRAKWVADPTLRVLDVREDHEWTQGHIPGSEHVGRGVLERDIERLVPEVDAPIYLLCGGGFRSALAAESLQKMGYSQVISVAGGYRGWKSLGYPTT